MFICKVRRSEIAGTIRAFDYILAHGCILGFRSSSRVYLASCGIADPARIAYISYNAAAGKLHDLPGDHR